MLVMSVLCYVYAPGYKQQPKPLHHNVI